MKIFKPKLPSTQPSRLQSLKLIPLGGVGDVTKNMYVYEYGDDIIIIDCGVGFPDEVMLGIDLVIPDISYLRDKKSQIRGIIITHGHDDHIGGLPFLWPELNCPIYTQRFTAGLIKAKFSEFNLPKAKIQTIDIDSILSLGVFKLFFYQVAHSIPDSMGIVIDTPVGRIIHQSDFKIDWNPVSSQLTDVAKVALSGKAGVILMLIDALRSERKGYNPSEQTIQPILQNIIARATGKVLITTTSSNVARIQQAVNVALSLNRKVAFVGRSMESYSQVARDLGYLKVPAGIVIAADEIKRFADSRLLIVIAGSQGQADSALSRAANNDHRQVQLKKGDMVIFSADAIPSSEAAQSALIDKLVKAGMEVYYSAVTEGVHISGHAAAEELKLMISLARPKYLMPIGATFKQMKAFQYLAKELGYPQDKILLLEDGQTVDIRKEGITTGELISVRNVYVDGLGIGDVGSVVLRDRQVLAEEGIVTVIIPIEARTGRLVGDIDIVSRGFVFEKEAEGIIENAKQIVRSDLKQKEDSLRDWRFIRRQIEGSLEKYLYEEIKRRPMILPIVVEV